MFARTIIWMDVWMDIWMDDLIEIDGSIGAVPIYGVYFTRYPIRIFLPTVPDITSKVNRCNDTTVKR